mgnify:CR=1 FL=1
MTDVTALAIEAPATALVALIFYKLWKCRCRLGLRESHGHIDYNVQVGSGSPIMDNDNIELGLESEESIQEVGETSIVIPQDTENENKL